MSEAPYSEETSKRDYQFLGIKYKERSAQSNANEFLSKDSESGCARTCLIENRHQMKTAVVDTSSINLFVGTAKIEEKLGRELFEDGVDERVRNIETHFGILQPPANLTLMERVKILEDKMLKIEQTYPQIAVRCFNYGSAEVLASSRPGGRVSTLLDARPPPTKKRKEDPGAAVKLRLAELSKKLSK